MKRDRKEERNNKGEKNVNEEVEGRQKRETE